METIRESINNLRRIANMMPKNITEAMDFDEEFNEEPTEEFAAKEDVPYVNDNPIEKEEKTDTCDTQSVRTLFREIHKKTLTAMAELDNPDCPEYENLKRIWQLCDKALSERHDNKDLDKNYSL